MNIAHNGSYTSDWNGLNATVRSILAFFVIVGLSGNSLVLIMFYRLKRLKTWDNAFTINLAVGDLTSSVAAVALVFSPEFLTARITSCHLLGLIQGCRLANFLVLQEIALLRYWRVHRPGRIINKSVFVTGLVIPWIVGIAYRFIVISQVKDYQSVSLRGIFFATGVYQHLASFNDHPTFDCGRNCRDDDMLHENYDILQTPMSRPCPDHCSGSDGNSNGKHFWLAFCSEDARILPKPNKWRSTGCDKQFAGCRCLLYDGHTDCGIDTFLP